MDNGRLTLHSSVRTDFKRKVLFRGTLSALAGAIPLVFAGIFMPWDILSVWGFPLFLSALALIALGLLPYRLLTTLELKPYEIVLLEDKELQFFAQGKKKFTVPVASIAKTFFFETKHTYGIGIDLKDPLPEKIIVQDRNFDMERFRKRSLKQYGSVIFFPYFTERSHCSLEKHLNEQMDSRPCRSTIFYQ